MIGGTSEKGRKNTISSFFFFTMNYIILMIILTYTFPREETLSKGSNHLCFLNTSSRKFGLIFGYRRQINTCAFKNWYFKKAADIIGLQRNVCEFRGDVMNDWNQGTCTASPRYYGTDVTSFPWFQSFISRNCDVLPKTVQLYCV
mgnify:CR=1 FL=1